MIRDMRYAIRPYGRPYGRDTKSEIGFSLVELMVVVGIIVLLVGIIIPSVSQFRLAAMNTTTRSRIALIDGACDMYHNDFDAYPPSNDDDFPDLENPEWHGSELIVLFLTGYGPDNNSDGIPVVGEMDDDDGKAGFGFRIVQRGRVYGPYNGVEQLETEQSSNGRAEFIDAFKNPILYYRFNETDNEYKADDNSDDPADPDEYAKDPSPSGLYYRQDYFLCSPGFDSWRKQTMKWDSGIDSDDDITNFGND